MTDIYTAIMKAADWIERHPDLYYFQNCRVPDCGTPGCVLGWIGHFAGVEIGSDVLRGVAAPLLHEMGDLHCTLEFYDKIQSLSGRVEAFTSNVESAVRGMRAYAVKYHAPKVPDWEAIAAVPPLTYQSSEMVQA